MLDTPDEENLDDKALMKKLNSFNISGFLYLCKTCEEANIPSKTTSRKSKKKKKADPVSSSQINSNSNSQVDDENALIVPDSD